MINLPTFEMLISPTLEAIRELDGWAKKADISAIVAKKLQLTEEQLALAYPSGRSTYFNNRMNEVRLYLLNENLISQPRTGIWQLTEKGWTTIEVEASSIDSAGLHRRRRRSKSQSAIATSGSQIQATDAAIPFDDLVKSHNDWRDELFQILSLLPTKKIERFFTRIFGSEGIDQVEVVNASGNGDIEGTMVSGGFLTFRVAFKFVRGNKLLNNNDVDNFRRSTQASGSDKGIILTTGRFTDEAARDALRGASPKIELIDGEQLINKLKELGLGVKTEQVIVERVVIDKVWFEGI